MDRRQDSLHLHGLLGVEKIGRAVKHTGNPQSSEGPLHALSLLIGSYQHGDVLLPKGLIPSDGFPLLCQVKQPGDLGCHSPNDGVPGLTFGDRFPRIRHAVRIQQPQLQGRIGPAGEGQCDIIPPGGRGREERYPFIDERQASL